METPHNSLFPEHPPRDDSFYQAGKLAKAAAAKGAKGPKPVSSQLQLDMSPYDLRREC